MEPVEKMIVDLSALHEKVVATGEEIETQMTKVDQQIDCYYEELHQQLQQQREEQKRKLQEISAQKKKAISLQLEQLEYTRAQLESLKELNNAVTNGSDRDALFAKKQFINDTKRLTESYRRLGTVTGFFVLVKNCPRIKIFRKFLSYGIKFFVLGQKFSEKFCPRTIIF